MITVMQCISEVLLLHDMLHYTEEVYGHAGPLLTRGHVKAVTYQRGILKSESCTFKKKYN